MRTLPVELWSIILEQTILSVSRVVCKKWRRIIEQSPAWNPRMHSLWYETIIAGNLHVLKWTRKARYDIGDKSIAFEYAIAYDRLQVLKWMFEHYNESAIRIFRRAICYERKNIAKWACGRFASQSVSPKSFDRAVSILAMME